LKKYKISNIKWYLSVSFRKLRNQIRFNNLNKHISEGFVNKDILIKYNKSRVTGPEPCVCHAPLRSLYFDIHGKATACCFNRTYILGQYPYNGISEIINGENRTFLQNQLCRQNFMYGCQHCHKLIDAGNFEGVEARLYDNLKNQKNVPSEIVFELDNTCNLECIMCHGEFSSSIAKKQGLSKIQHPYDDEFISQIKNYIPYLKVAKFLGGEPFLINIYYKLWDLIIDLNPKCKIILQTNGTIFNEKVKDYLNRGNFYIGISVDSLDKRNFEHIRKNAIFETVMNNIDEFIKVSNKKGNFVNISVCPMQQNWKEIPDIVKFCNARNVFIYFNTVYTEGFAISELPEEKLFEILTYYKTSKIAAKSYIAKRNSRFFRNFISNVESWYNVKEIESRFTRKRHLWNYNKLREALILKLNEDESAIKVLDEVIDKSNTEFYLSDENVQTLDNTKSEDIINALKTESKDKIRHRMLSFVEKGKFGE